MAIVSEELCYYTYKPTRLLFKEVVLNLYQHSQDRFAACKVH